MLFKFHSLIALLILVTLTSPSFAEVTISEHLLNQEIDEETVESTRADYQQTQILNGSIRTRMGAHTFCWVGPAACLAGTEKLNTLANEIPQRGFDQIYVGDRFQDVAIQNDGSTWVVIDGSKSINEIKKFLEKQKINLPKILAMKAANARTQRLSQAIRSKTNSVAFCWVGARQCLTGMKKLNSVVDAKDIQGKGFDQFYVGDRFQNVQINNDGSSMVVVDRKASKSEMTNFLRQQTVDTPHVNAMKHDYAQTLLLGQSIRSKTGAHTFCWVSANSCYVGMEKLEKLADDPKIQEKGFGQIYVSDRFEDVRIVDSGATMVVVDGRAPVGKMIKHLLEKP